MSTITDELTVFKQEEIKLCGEALPVDIVSPGDQLPLEDNSVDFVVSSHVIEHFPDPIKALSEWYRVVKPGGYLYIIAPHKERTFDNERPAYHAGRADRTPRDRQPVPIPTSTIARFGLPRISSN